jgi:hypothetical protein
MTNNQINKELKEMYQNLRDPEARNKQKEKGKRERRIKNRKEDYGL